MHSHPRSHADRYHMMDFAASVANCKPNAEIRFQFRVVGEDEALLEDGEILPTFAGEDPRGGRGHPFDLIISDAFVSADC